MCVSSFRDRRTFKLSVIILAPRNPLSQDSITANRPVALMSVVVKSFKRLLSAQSDLPDHIWRKSSCQSHCLSVTQSQSGIHSQSKIIAYRYLFLGRLILWHETQNMRYFTELRERFEQYRWEMSDIHQEIAACVKGLHYSSVQLIYC